ncbi:hypothetical protein H4R18_005965 [Coemansia javaensis]|uniref:lytic cellulose monooxygenase (C4-dehydrogenating) n=1 Tax=Coemansia javaensis TaxID=2761396 RepID=A0A9W8H064_9FUNG|nr:hypothetical protein H4R18_005974 [Coemansia javaensis]KAJ2775640.1 hypothetical protein H4R18_005965 [Coemansia javaensis]
MARPEWSSRNGPVRDVTSKDLTCRTSNPTGAGIKSCPVTAGSMMAIYYNRNRDGKADVISASHTGPVLAYIAPLESNGQGDVWVKLYEAGWDKGTKEWATDKLIRENGIYSFTIPPELKNGEYLVRGEIIALHNARTKGGAQFYPGCAHITVTGGGSTPLPKGVAIPGAYKDDDPGILYARKKGGDNSGYIIPGPPVYVSKGVSATPPQNTTSPTPPKKVCNKKRAKPVKREAAEAAA